MENREQKYLELFTDKENREYFPYIRPIHIRDAIKFGHLRAIEEFPNGIVYGIIIFKEYKRPGSKSIGNKGDIHISEIVVNPNYKRRGIGRLLLKLAEKEAALSNGRVVLSMVKSNKIALNFYKVYGYKIKDRILFPKKNNEPEPGYILEKIVEKIYPIKDENKEIEINKEENESKEKLKPKRQYKKKPINITENTLEDFNENFKTRTEEEPKKKRGRKPKNIL